MRPGELQSDDIDALDCDKGDGLLPAIVQDADSGAVLMLGYMNREALRETFARGRVVFFSRSKQRLWEKGETSGHTLDLVESAPTATATRCSSRAAARSGLPSRHATCFGDDPVTQAGRVWRSSARSKRHRAAASPKRPEGSYTARLLCAGHEAHRPEGRRGRRGGRAGRAPRKPMTR